MAVTTRNRRAACLGIALPFRVWPNPDGSLAIEADRLHGAFLYPGIAAGEGSPATDYGLDLNTRLANYLNDTYGPYAVPDATSRLAYGLTQYGGAEANQRLQAIIADASQGLT